MATVLGAPGVADRVLNEACAHQRTQEDFDEVALAI
jgi:hypothetical protein